MKNLLSIVFISLNFFVVSQKDYLNGTWQGLDVNLGESNNKGKAIWFNINIDNKTKLVSGAARIETPFTDYYVIKSIKGKVISENEIQFEDVMFGNKKNSGQSYWCLLKGKLKYSEQTGYFTGEYTSSDCRNNVGKITMFKSKHEMSMTDTVSLYHSWINNFVNDLARGWSAYYVRDEEMKDFQFKPVYFDHDEDVLKIEHHFFLNQMVRIVESHSDLRIKIIGHTDSNGPDQYNVQLSRRRADVIKAFLLGLGIKEEKIVIEFRGEKDPAVSNTTSGGKQLNRRVDFEFI
jgi:OOP family OmpA-OmpF porin